MDTKPKLNPVERVLRYAQMIVEMNHNHDRYETVLTELERALEDVGSLESKTDTVTVSLQRAFAGVDYNGGAK